jgi:hypothetical protein
VQPDSLMDLDSIPTSRAGRQERPPYTFVYRSFSAQQVPGFSVASMLGERIMRRQIDG